MLKILNNGQDLGTIKVNMPTNFSVQFKNNGTTPATNIRVGRLSCGACTSASISQAFQSLSAGATGTMSVVYRPKSTGTIPRSVTIEYTQDGISNTELFSFTATSVN